MSWQSFTIKIRPLAYMADRHGRLVIAADELIRPGFSLRAGEVFLVFSVHELEFDNAEVLALPLESMHLYTCTTATKEAPEAYPVLSLAGVAVRRLEQ